MSESTGRETKNTSAPRAAPPTPAPASALAFAKSKTRVAKRGSTGCARALFFTRALIGQASARIIIPTKARPTPPVSGGTKAGSPRLVSSHCMAQITTAPPNTNALRVLALVWVMGSRLATQPVAGTRVRVQEFLLRDQFPPRAPTQTGARVLEGAEE